MHIKHFIFDLKDKVKIKELNRPGIITGLLSESEGEFYRVCYWDSCSRKSEWMYSFELEKTE